MANTSSYNSDKAMDIDYGIDPASGGFFNSDYKKNDDLKQMLDVNKDSMKLEAMKRIIGMMAKGRDASDLFPAVVKNVVSKNIEVKKLVYVYLARYAEEQQDLALLSISTFQRALKDPNQLIRASALRVLSSIRVPMIIPIVMLAIKDSALDMSPYVRKTAAHAIPKLYSLDPEQKEELVLVIEKLLQDKTTLVVGSAVMAFEEVCPERIDMIHKSFRKLCNLLVDVDEWGQVFILNMLTRYARTQFTDPNLNDNSSDVDLDEEDKKPFYDEEGQVPVKENATVELDPDHRLLLKNAKPLFQSRNAAVVMSVAQLFHHLAPRREVAVIAKALVRLLRSSREVQTVVLSTIASLVVKRKALFTPYLKSFFVRSSDPTHVKTLKLEILTTLASESSIGSILREFQTYIASVDKAFVAATVQAIGKCAANISQVTDTCLTGLVSLLSNSDEAVVGESVVVIKNLLQASPEAYVDIIGHMVRLIDSIQVPTARAAILWLLGEHSQLVPHLAPDLLRKSAKTFEDEEDIVKLQVLNLAVKLYLRNPGQTTLLCQYVLSLARYDANYDIRDRARLLRLLLFPTPGTEGAPESRFTREARNIFLVAKPAPVCTPVDPDTEVYQLGSLSHHIHARVPGYLELPSWPETAPDAAVRQTATPPPQVEEPGLGARAREITGAGATGIGAGKTRAFYTSGSDSETEDEEEDGEEEGSENEESSSEEEESSEEESDGSEESSEEEEVKPKNKAAVKTPVNNKSAVSIKTPVNSRTKPATSKSKPAPPAAKDNNSSKTSTTAHKSNVDLLLDLDDFNMTGGTNFITPTLGGFLSPLTPQNGGSTPVSSSQKPGISLLPSAYCTPKYTEVLNKITVGRGMLSALAAFSRVPCVASERMIVISLRLQNHHTAPLTHICLENTGSHLFPFPEVVSLAPGISTEVNLGVDLRDSSQPLVARLQWEVEEEKYTVEVKLTAPAGEWLRPVSMSPELFMEHKNKLTGMNEHKGQLKGSVTPSTLFQIANVGLVSSDESILRFAGQSVSSGSLVLITVESGDITVNCEKMVLGSMLLTDIVKHFSSN